MSLNEIGKPSAALEWWWEGADFYTRSREGTVVYEDCKLIAVYSEPYPHCRVMSMELIYSRGGERK